MTLTPLLFLLRPTHRDEMCNFYLMYYTPANKGESYFHCSDDSVPRLSDKLPDESDSPLPSNPLLENWASGILSSGRPASHLNAENYDIFYDYYDTDKPKFDYYYDIPNLYKSYSPYRKQFYQNVQRQPPAIKQPYMQRPHHDNMVDHGSVEASRNRVTEKVIHETEKPKKFTVCKSQNIRFCCNLIFSHFTVVGLNSRLYKQVRSKVFRGFNILLSFKIFHKCKIKSLVIRSKISFICHLYPTCFIPLFYLIY